MCVNIDFILNGTLTGSDFILPANSFSKLAVAISTVGLCQLQNIFRNFRKTNSYVSGSNNGNDNMHEVNKYIFFSKSRPVDNISVNSQI